MRIYRVNISVKVLVIIISLIIGSSGILTFYIVQASLLQRICGFLAVILFVIISYFVHKEKIIVDDEKIEVHIPLRKYNLLFWNEIKELTSFYVLCPEAGSITLMPEVQMAKKNVYISMFGMPIELLKDIISHLPSDAKIELYTYLERKLEGKQTWFFKKQEYHKTDVNYWLNLWRK